MLAHKAKILFQVSNGSRPLSLGASDEALERNNGSTYTQLGTLFVIYLALRLVLLLADLVSKSITHASNWLSPFLAWDGHWYIQVARTWYPLTGYSHVKGLTYAAGGFEPGWPFSIRVGAALGLSYSFSAYVMSFIFGIVTLFAIWRLCLELYGQERSFWASVSVLVFPGIAVCFGIGYSEVMSIGLVALSLYELMKKRWILSAMAGFVATATSSLAVVLIVPYAVEAYLALRARRDYGSIWPLAIAPLGFVGYVAYLGFKARDPFYWWTLQGTAWGAKLDLGYPLHWLIAGRGSSWGIYWVALIGLMVMIYLLTITTVSVLPVSIKLYCTAVALMLVFNPALGPKPRFLFWLFPAVSLLGVKLKPRSLQVVLLVSAWLTPLVFIAYTTIGNTVAQP